MRSSDRERVLNEVVGRVVEQKVTQGARLDEVVADSVDHERRCLKGERGEEVDFWGDVGAGPGRVSERELQAVL